MFRHTVDKCNTCTLVLMGVMAHLVTGFVLCCGGLYVFYFERWLSLTRVTTVIFITEAMESLCKTDSTHWLVRSCRKASEHVGDVGGWMCRELWGCQMDRLLAA